MFMCVNVSSHEGVIRHSENRLYIYVNKLSITYVCVVVFLLWRIYIDKYIHIYIYIYICMHMENDVVIACLVVEAPTHCNTLQHIATHCNTLQQARCQRGKRGK